MFEKSGGLAVTSSQILEKASILKAWVHFNSKQIESTIIEMSRKLYTTPMKKPEWMDGQEPLKNWALSNVCNNQEFRVLRTEQESQWDFLKELGFLWNVLAELSSRQL